MKKLVLILCLIAYYQPTALATCQQNNSTCTIGEIQQQINFINSASSAWHELFEAYRDLEIFLESIGQDVSPDNVMLSAITPQPYYNAQATAYLAKLARLKAAMIAIGGCAS